MKRAADSPNLSISKNMKSSMPARHLFTFGYEGLNIEAFITRLQEMAVQWVVDVRELPLSRKRGFSKTKFQEQLAKAGISYVHVSSLGCPKQVRDRFRVDGNWPRYVRGFLAHLEKQQSAVSELAQLSRVSNACLVCFESDHTACHRSYVARAVQLRGGPPVMHLGAKTALLDPSLAKAA